MGLGLSELVLPVILLLVVGGFLLTRNNKALRIGGPTVILKRFKISDGSQDEPLVAIAGRAAGFTGWLLGLMKIGTESTLSVTRDELRVMTSGLAGRVDQSILLSDVSSTTCGSSKSIGYLLASIGVAGFSLWQVLSRSLGGSLGYAARTKGGALALGVIVAGVLFALYWFSRKIILKVESGGGMEIGLAFKPSLMEGVVADEGEVQQVAAIVKREVIRSKSTLT